MRLVCPQYLLATAIIASLFSACIYTPPELVFRDPAGDSDTTQNGGGDNLSTSGDVDTAGDGVATTGDGVMTGDADGGDSVSIDCGLTGNGHDDNCECTEAGRWDGGDITQDCFFTCDSWGYFQCDGQAICGYGPDADACGCEAGYYDLVTTGENHTCIPDCTTSAFSCASCVGPTDARLRLRSACSCGVGSQDEQETGFCQPTCGNEFPDLGANCKYDENGFPTPDCPPGTGFDPNSGDGGECVCAGFTNITCPTPAPYCLPDNDGVCKFFDYVLYVDANVDTGGGNNGSGSSWANAFTTINQALAAVGATRIGADTDLAIFIKTGNEKDYAVSEPGLMVPQRVSLFGGFKEATPTFNTRILASGLTKLEWTGPGYHPIVSLDGNNTIDGINMVGNLGSPGNGFTTVIGMIGAYATQDGSSFEIRNSIFSRHHADNGAAIDAWANGNSNTSLKVDRCLFSNNTAEQVGSTLSNRDGGAIRSLSMPSEISNSIFTANKASTGGAIYAESADVSISRSAFIANTAVALGGAINLISAQNITITDSLFQHNRAANAGAINWSQANGGGYAQSVESSLFLNNNTIETTGVSGGALLIDSVNFELVSNLFVANSAKIGSGGAISISDDGKGVIRNSTFAYNAAAKGNSIAAMENTTLTLVNTLLKTAVVAVNSELFEAAGSQTTVVRSIAASTTTCSGCLSGPMIIDDVEFAPALTTSGGDVSVSFKALRSPGIAKLELVTSPSTEPNDYVNRFLFIPAEGYFPIIAASFSGTIELVVAMPAATGLAIELAGAPGLDARIVTFIPVAASPALEHGQGFGDYATDMDICHRRRFDLFSKPNNGTDYPPFTDIGAFERTDVDDIPDLSECGGFGDAIRERFQL